MDSVLLQIDVDLWKSLSDNPGLCLGPNGPGLPSTNFVGTVPVFQLGDNLSVWEEFFPDSLALLQGRGGDVLLQERGGNALLLEHVSPLL